MKTLELKNFGEGEDLTDGDFSSDQNRFLELINYRITNAGRIQRRPPVIKVVDTFGSNTTGLIERDGQRLTFIPRGEVADIETPTDVDVLEFDPPNNVVSSSIEDVCNLGDTFVVLMRHEDSSSIWFYALHIFDDAPNKYTYTDDPAFPWYHIRAVSSAALKRAVLTVAGSKVWICGPDGNTYGSGVANARKWNLFTLPELLRYGYQFHYYNSAGVDGVVQVTIPVNFLDVNYSPYSLLGSPIGNFRMQEFIDAGDINHNDAFREDKWANASSEIGKEYNENVTTTPASNQWSYGQTANLAVNATYDFWVNAYVHMKAGRWYRFTWTPANITGSAGRLKVVSGMFEPDKTSAYGWSPSTYQFMLADSGQKQFELNDKFFYTATPEHFEVSVNGVVKTVTTDYTISQSDTNKVKLTLVTGATASDAVEVRQLLFVHLISTSQYSIVVPPGIMRIDGIDYNFPGSSIVMPDENAALGVTNHRITINTRNLVNGSGSLLEDNSGSGGGNPAYKSWTNYLLLDAYVQYPSVPVAQVSYDYNYTASAQQEAAYQDAEDYAGSSASERDTVVLPTASHDSGGGIPTLLYGIKNRLLVGYSGGMQLWSVNEDANQDEKLDISPVGTGNQLQPHGVLFGGGVMAPMENGYWLIGLGGDLSDKLSDDRVGEKIERFGVPQVSTAVFWPWLGEYIAVETVNGNFRFRVLDLHRSKKISGWSRWTLTGITGVDYKTMIPVKDKLYFRSGEDLYYIDAGAYDRATATGTFRDSNDTAGDGNAYVSRAVWRYNDFKKPKIKKDIRGIDVIQTPCGLSVFGQDATATFDFRPVGYNPNLIEFGPTITGSTYGKDTCELSMETDQLSVVMESTDELGHELQALAILFDYQED